MKKIFSCILFLSFILVFSQKREFTAPNYKKIESAVKDKNSEYYYPTLIEKFNASDSTMTLEQKRHTYYGFVFQDQYSPYHFSDYSKKLNESINKENLTNDDFKKIIKLCDFVLIENPFDLRALSYKSFCLNKLEEKAELEKNIAKVNIVMEVLISSGDGISKETAFYVTNTSNEYDLLNMLGFEFGGKQSLIDHYDYLKLAENEYKIEGFYFDISPALENLSKKMK